MSWRDLLSIKVTDDFGFDVKLGWPLLLLAAAVLGAWLFYSLRRRKWFGKWSVVEAEVELGGIGKVTLRPSHDDIQVAHKAWVELVTRKAALPFDSDHDVVVEVYNSWYALFQEMRVLAKSIPAERMRESKDTRQLVRLLVEALNLGLRPHLTKWQARFRHWYAGASTKSPDKCPQDVQRDYPHFAEMSADLLKVNKQLVAYATFIKKIAQGETA
jgi:hypothetical protein